MLDQYDVIIIGAGPAGLSCAIELQKSDRKVLLLERNGLIGPKNCAGGLTTKIKDLDIPLDIAEVLFSSIDLSVLDKKVSILNEYIPFVGTIDRGKLGNFLLEKLSDKITVKTNSIVSQVGDDFVLVEGKKIKAGHIIGADGSNSIVRKYLGLKNNKYITAIQYLVPDIYKNLEFFIDTDLFGSGYAWIFPHKDYTSVGCCRSMEINERSNLKKNFDAWLNKRGISIKGAKLQGGLINFDYQGFDFGNKYLVGDAGGFASGLTGEGIYFALISGRDVARRIINANYGCPNIEKILQVKRGHEKTLLFITLSIKFSRFLTNKFLKALLGLSKYRWFTRKLIKHYG